MMIGHLTIAGLAESVISAGLVAYLQRSDLSLLRGVGALGTAQGGLVSQPASPQRLWWAVVALMLFTPLGILAAGTAWGEWTSTDLKTHTLGLRSRTRLPTRLPRRAHRLDYRS